MFNCKWNLFVNLWRSLLCDQVYTIYSDARNYAGGVSATLTAFIAILTSVPQPVLVRTTFLSPQGSVRFQRHKPKWMFTKIVVPPNHPFWGATIFGNTQMTCLQKLGILTNGITFSIADPKNSTFWRLLLHSFLWRWDVEHIFSIFFHDLPILFKDFNIFLCLADKTPFLTTKNQWFLGARGFFCWENGDDFVRCFKASFPLA